MCERAALKSSVRIIRGAHLLWGYCGDKLSEARPRIGDLRCTRIREELEDREGTRMARGGKGGSAYSCLARPKESLFSAGTGWPASCLIPYSPLISPIPRTVRLLARSLLSDSSLPLARSSKHRCANSRLATRVRWSTLQTFELRFLR